MDKTIYCPRGFDIRPLLKPLNAARLMGSAGRDYRIDKTRDSPLLFALIYLPKSLRSKQTGNRMSLSWLHIKMAAQARKWMKQDLAPNEIREAWIAPRGAAKSTWLFLILILWAAAHGHRKYIACFSDGGRMAEQHLATLRKVLDENDLLRNDFPDLCTPAKRTGGYNTGDNAKMYKSVSGVTIQAMGIDSKSLGLKSGDDRPDLLVFDDIEPAESDYSAEQKLKRQNSMIDKCFAMNPNAVVQIAGTTTMFGSIIHDLVRSVTDVDDEPPDWILAEEIKVRYFPAIMTDDNGEEYSLWPERWELWWLRKKREQKGSDYAKNFDNNPAIAGFGDGWKKSDFRYNPPFKTAKMALAIDPATTSKRTSDFTGLAVISTNKEEDRCVIEEAIGVRLSPLRLRALVHDILRRNPYILEVVIEVTQGGDTWSDILLPFPRRGIKLTTRTPKDPKPVRINQLLDYFQREWVWLRKKLPPLEAQCLHYPNVLNDDIVDAVSMGVNHFLADNLVGVS